MSEITSVQKKLILLVGILAIMGIFFIFKARLDGDIKPTLTTDEIATLSDFELMRRMRIDLLARSSVSDSAADNLPAAILPVSRTIEFEDTMAAIGFTNAIPTDVVRDKLITAYTELGAFPVADVIQTFNPGQQSPPGIDLALTKALNKANVQKLRLTWVREHAKAFGKR